MQVCAMCPAVLRDPTVLKPWQRDPGPLQNVVKDDVRVYTPLLLLAYHALYTEDMTTVSKMGHTIVMSLPLLRVRRRNRPVA
jgi:hypothetical protein